ncbi:MAG: TIGR01244 family phosphatase [Methylobacterium mesophilicum]|nr:TIGR01244 family phosphatase [Methylobacterium mesophilicum]
MEIRPVTEDYAVSPQITPEDVDAVREAGFKSIIAHRPDGEQPDQPTAESIRQAAEKAGLGFRHIPVAGSGMTQANVDEMRAALDELEGPVFAYCRSGARSTNIFNVARQER